MLKSYTTTKPHNNIPLPKVWDGKSAHSCVQQIACRLYYCMKESSLLRQNICIVSCTESLFCSSRRDAHKRTPKLCLKYGTESCLLKYNSKLTLLNSIEKHLYK